MGGQHFRMSPAAVGWQTGLRNKLHIVSLHILGFLCFPSLEGLQNEHCPKRNVQVDIV